MGNIILVTGGGRSGKSSYAQKLAESRPGGRGFVATCPVIDDEMQERVVKHQEARRGKGWETFEEPLSIADAIANAHHCATLVVDCLTLWINNLLYEAEQKGATLSESDVADACHRVIAACKAHPGTVVFVTNEVGMGIIPENPLARRYRDLVGRCNQVVADASMRTVLLVSGQPIDIKNLT